MATSALKQQEPEPQRGPSMGEINLLWTHYKTARSTLERLAADAEAGKLDMHSPYVERAVRVLEVLVLRKEKGKTHFLTMTLGAPVIVNNPEYDAQGDGKRRSELPPTDDVPELVRRMLAELEHAMRPSARPGGRALDVSKAAKTLQEAMEAARSKPKAAAAPIPASEKEEKDSAACCSSSSSSVRVKEAAPLPAPTGVGELRKHVGGHHHHKHAHSSAGNSGGCCASEQKEEEEKEQGTWLVQGTAAAVMAWVRAALSGPAQVQEHMQTCAPGGGCCGGGAAGPSRMGAKQDGHAFMVGVLATVLLLPFVLWWMS